MQEGWRRKSRTWQKKKSSHTQYKCTAMSQRWTNTIIRYIYIYIYIYTSCVWESSVAVTLTTKKAKRKKNCRETERDKERGPGMSRNSRVSVEIYQSASYGNEPQASCREKLAWLEPPSHPSIYLQRCAAFASAAKSKGAPRVRVRCRVAAEAS